MGDLFATRCATCGRMLVADEFTWSAEGDGPARPIDPPLPLHGLPRPARRVRAAPGAARARRRRARVDGRRGLAAARAWARDRFPVVDGAPGPRRRAARPAYAAPARRPDRDHGTDRGRPAGRAGARRAAAGPAPRAAAVEPARRRCGPGGALRVAGGHVRLPGRDPVARAQPVARVRGRVPGRARVRPAPRGRRARAAPGAPRRGPAGPRPRARRRPSSPSPARRPCAR